MNQHLSRKNYNCNKIFSKRSKINLEHTFLNVFEEVLDLRVLKLISTRKMLDYYLDVPPVESFSIT